MVRRRSLLFILFISLLSGGYRSGAQTAEGLFTEAIQLEEVKSDSEKAILHTVLTLLNNSLTYLQVWFCSFEHE